MPRDLLRKLNFDVSGLRSKSWNELAGPDAPKLDFVFTVCDNAAAETCPVWPGQPMTAHWGIPDPAAVTGNEAETHLAFADTYPDAQQSDLHFRQPADRVARHAGAAKASGFDRPHEARRRQPGLGRVMSEMQHPLGTTPHRRGARHRDSGRHRGRLRHHGRTLAGGNQAVALLGNTIPTGAILVVIITILGPVSGAHFNPAVTLVFAGREEFPWSEVDALHRRLNASAASAARCWRI